MPLENVAPRRDSLLAMMGETQPWHPVWISVYKAKALTPHNYRHDCVLFAGDAGHLVSIFGMRGANAGIDDADNLAWKLAYVVKSQAPQALLDSYSDERVYAVRENRAPRHGKHGKYGIQGAAHVCLRADAHGRAGPGGQTCARAFADQPAPSQRQTSAIASAQSPLNAPDVDVFTAVPAPGTVSPECPLARRQDGAQQAGYITDLVQRAVGAFMDLYFSDDGCVPAQLLVLATSCR
ncbi:FAD-dependent monooxygenase [Janthinobacterium sp. MDT1-19]|uniref:FAD-dependent monooxygenase n=1 Tax=Janthinobacterium sp. MDT1-19 TaxID=1259339 RepID=UPI003F207B23